MLKEFSLIEITLEKTVSTAIPSPGTNFSKGLREYNMNPIQVRYLTALHPDTPYATTFSRVQQIATPNESYGSSPNFSYGKPSLKLYSLKLGGRPQTTPNFSMTANPYPIESELTFGSFAPTEVVVLSVMSLPRRYHHEDRAGSPRVYRQPDFVRP